jgi:hypothetical protein
MQLVNRMLDRGEVRFDRLHRNALRDLDRGQSSSVGRLAPPPEW